MITKTLLLLSFFCCVQSSAFSQLVDTVFDQSNTSVFTTNAFRCIGIGKDGHVWVGTSQQGLYKFDGEKWEKFAGLTNNLINDIKPDKLGSIWVAQSGNTGAQALTGGVCHFPSGKTFNSPEYYAPSRGLPTRYARSLYIDTTRYIYGTANGLYAPTMPVWVACMGNITAGISSTGAIGRGLQIVEGAKKDFQTIKEGVDVSNNLGSVQTIGGDLSEVWAYAANNFGKSQILVYNYLTGKFRFAYDYQNNPEPNLFTQNFQARAIYFDAKGRRWIGLATGEVIVKDNTGKWYKIQLPTSSITSVNVNAITGDKSGNVYFGTTDGLVIYNGGLLTDPTSFKRYSVLDDLPSANVTGVAVDHRNLTVWLATSEGVVRLGAPFTVYNLVHLQSDNARLHGALRKLAAKDSSEIRNLVSRTEKYRVTRAYEKSKQVNDLPIDINIAADSSISTLIVYTGNYPAKKELKINTSIAGVPISNDNYTTTFGQLIEITRNEDSLVYLYHHPTFVYLGENAKSVSYDFVLRDKQTKETAHEGKVKFFHTPVLFVHGVWSSVMAFESMLNYFASTSNNYSEHQLLRWWYPNPDHTEPGKDRTASDYQIVIPLGIDRLLKQSRENNLSAGKVNIVGHSRGGLLSRIYLQSNSVTFRNDVKSLITVNSPHWGSQGGNLVTDNRIMAFTPWGTAVRVGEVMKFMMLENFDDPNGAYDLRVNSDFIKNELNILSKTEKNPVPVHAITSTYEFGLSRADLLKTFVLKSGKKVPYAGKLIFVLRFYALLLGTRCVDGSIDECLKEIFHGEENDVVVPLSSQQGGLDGKYVTYIGKKVGHSKKVLDFIINIVDVPSVLDVPSTQSRLVELLREDPYEGTSDFIVKGFKPPAAMLKYSFLPNVAGDPNGRVANGDATLSIDPSIKGTTYQYGQTAEVAVKGSDNITSILIAYSSSSLKEIASDVDENKTSTFYYPVPKEASGKVLITAYGFNATGLVAIDTSYINVDIPSTAVLDSVRFARNYLDRFVVPAGDSIPFAVMGYYSDTVRNITYLPGLSYAFVSGGVANISSPDYLKGNLPGGLDQLSVSYLDKSDTIDVEVTDSVARAIAGITLPVRFLSFSGEFRSGVVNLQWKTSEELNNKYFEIEHSTNGNTFQTIGLVAARGSISGAAIAIYNFVTGTFREGKNFYRLKQVDNDGNFSYSTITIVWINRTVSISLYPNPTRSQVTLALSENLPKCQLQLTNMLGQTVHTMFLNGNAGKQVIDLQHLTRGFYIVTLTSESGEYLLREKLVIN